MKPERRIHFNSQKYLNLLFIAFVFCILFTRFIIFLRYNLVVIDTDQPYMWMGAVDYAKGIFNEPRYYGQGYNTYMEALFAVPLLWLKVPVYYAVPLATHFISLFPFLFTGFYLFYKQQKVQGLLSLAVILCLPAPYDLLNSLPRGFVTGLFFCSFYVISLLNPKNLRWLGFNTMMGVIGYFVNPNSVLVTAPVLFYLFVNNFQNKKYYFISLPAILLVWPLHLFFNGFYNSHPGYKIHPFENVFSSYVFGENISHLDWRFAHISFFFQNNCLLLLLVLAAIGIVLFLQNKKAFLAFGLFIGVLLISFSASKTLEGSLWVFMSSGRMYLGIPLLIALWLPLIKMDFPKWLLPILLIPVVFTCIKLGRLEKNLDWNYEERYWGGVRLTPLKNAIGMIDAYKKICDNHKVDYFLVSSYFWMNTILSTAGPAIYEDYPEVQETFFEKRYWVREKNKNRVVSRFIVLARASNLEQCMPSNKNFKLHKLDDFGLYLVTENKRTINEFLILLRACEPKYN